ncbi:uncharacterized protein LOC128273317 [Anopheles cruzii]|uniref:uncharacterized protein LOC128273317 n=1 Tax=Anopheles cruzii TaxID=68878 RepID=UPI0022EC3480|nr:uncharacterized protein LOC128273317 [Anopheles cruzii]
MWSEAMSSLAKMYPKLSQVELSAILMKGAAMSSSLERDSGFNSGSSEHEDDLKSLDQSSRDGLISPENSCEDSIEVKLPATLTSATTTTTPSAAGSLVKNKRKSSEPLRVVAETELLAPLKKRIRYQDSSTKHEEDEEEDLRSVSRAAAASPFRPWAPEGTGLHMPPHHTSSPFPSPADLLVRHPAVTTLHRAPFSATNSIEQLQPLALVAKKSNPSSSEAHQALPRPSSSRSTAECSSNAAEGDQSDLAHKLHLLQEHHRHSRLHHDVQHHHPHQHHLLGFVAPRGGAPTSLDGTNDDGGGGDSLIVDNDDDTKASGSGALSATQSRNYKNMTRERRIEANARERTRVHTISAAYEKLRRAIPAYSNAQKLSKLSILRIACSYILTLSRMAGEDYSEDASEPSIADCVAMVTRTIQTEGKIRKKKDD